MGGVVFKQDGEIKFLVRKGKFSPKYPGSGDWSLPKGWIDDENGGPGPKTLGKKRASGAEMMESALREVREEGGVEAEVVKRLGEIKFFYVNEEKEKIFKTVIFYLMKFVKESPEGYGEESEEVRWVSEKEVGELLKKRKDEWGLVKKARVEVESYVS